MFFLTSCPGLDPRADPKDHYGLVSHRHECPERARPVSDKGAAAPPVGLRVADLASAVPAPEKVRLLLGPRSVGCICQLPERVTHVGKAGPGIENDSA